MESCNDQPCLGQRHGELKLQQVAEHVPRLSDFCCRLAVWLEPFGPHGMVGAPRPVVELLMAVIT